MENGQKIKENTGKNKFTPSENLLEQGGCAAEFALKQQFPSLAGQHSKQTHTTNGHWKWKKPCNYICYWTRLLTLPFLFVLKDGETPESRKVQFKGCI